MKELFRRINNLGITTVRKISVTPNSHPSTSHELILIFILIINKMSSEDRYVFVAEWYDQQASLLRKFYIGYYLSDKTIDIVSRDLFGYFIMHQNC